MKIDFNAMLVDYDDKPLFFDKDDHATLKKMAVRALMSPELDATGRAQTLPAEQMIERDDLARRIHKASEPLEITVEEAGLIKKMIPVVFIHPMFVAQALRLIEGTSAGVA